MLGIIFTSLLITIFGGIGYYFSNVLLLHNYSRTYGKDPKKQHLIQQFQRLVTTLHAQSITIPSPLGYDLVGYYFPTDIPSRKTIITVHGYTGSKDHHGKYVSLFHKMGFNVIVYDQRNHGESGGNYISYGVLESIDLKAVVTYTKAHFPCESLGIHGVSMGASTLLLYGGKIEDGADFYIADCPYSDFAVQSQYRLQMEYKWIPRFLHQPLVLLGDGFVKLREHYSIREANPMKYLHRIQAPVLFINTKKDTYIPPSMTTTLYEAKRGPKEIYVTEEGDHAQAYKVNPVAYEQVIQQFLSTHVYNNKKNAFIHIR